MNSHVNGGNWAGEFFPRVANEGFALFTVDIMGHGYSEGTRALIDDWHDVFADLEALTEVRRNSMPASRQRCFKD
eukprot:g24151.t1